MGRVAKATWGEVPDSLRCGFQDDGSKRGDGPSPRRHLQVSQIVFMDGAQRSPRKRELCAMPLAIISRSRTAACTLAVPRRSYTMKMISAVLIALALLSMAAPVYAFDAKSFYEQLDRQPN